VTARDETASRSRKVKAVLAGGMVLGVGAAVTLAAWTDYEFVSNEFTSGTFNVQGSVDGTTFADHPAVGQAATLQFAGDFANLSPGTTVASPFVLRLAEGTTYDATVTLSSSLVQAGDPAGLTYSVVQVGGLSDCEPGATGTTDVVPAGTALGSVAGAAPFALTHVDGAAGDAVTLCFQVTAGDALQQGESVDVAWEFAATSE
jgi:predicted ribosomally synthesized peptide with SipW-like signal peptide